MSTAYQSGGLEKKIEVVDKKVSDMDDRIVALLIQQGELAGQLRLVYSSYLLVHFSSLLSYKGTDPHARYYCCPTRRCKQKPADANRCSAFTEFPSICYIQDFDFNLTNFAMDSQT